MNTSALVVIDVQVNMFGPAPVNAAEELLERLVALVKRARAAQAPVVFVRNCGAPGDPDERGCPGWELHPSLQAATGELVLDKTTGDTFASTSLDNELKARGVTRVVLAGLQSEFCVRETVQGALARGYGVTLVTDGHGTYDTKGRPARQTIAEVNAEFENRVKLTTAREVRF